MKKNYVNGLTLFSVKKLLLGIGIQMAAIGAFNYSFSQSECLPVFQYNADGNMITRVQFNTIDQTSPFTSGTTPQYEDFRTISTDVTKGQTYPISVKGPSSTFPSDVVVFIDWDKNGIYDEPGIYIGLLGSANPANALTVTADIIIPTTAVAGVTKMRIVKNTNLAALSNPAAPNTITSACDASLRAGQTEEYSLNILPGANACSGDPGLNPGDLGCVSFTYNGQTTQYTTVRAADGNIWLQQNLGSSQIAVSATDADAFGDLFQWGRWDDGHQKRNSTISPVTPTPNNPTGLNNNNNFIAGNPKWWGTGSINDTWTATTPAAVTSTNSCDPCKALGNEWRIPSPAEWQTAINSEQITNVQSAFNSHLKMATGGTRNASGTFDFVGVRGYYWTSTPTESGGKLLYYSNTIVNPTAGYSREQGGAVRCMKMAPVTVSTIDVTTLNSTAAAITTNAGTLQLTSVITPSTINQAVNWSIRNVTGTAVISTTGLVTAQTNGTVWAKAISVQDPSLKDSIEITISGQIIAAQSISVATQNNVNPVITTLGGTLQMTAAILPATANQNVSWSIVNATGTANISAAGLVTAQTDGTVWAKATSVQNPTLKDSLKITISGQSINPQNINLTVLNNAAPSIAINAGTLQIVATIFPTTANQNVNWSIVNGTGNATISSTGLVTAHGNGIVWAKAVSAVNPALKDSLKITIVGQTNLGLEKNTIENIHIFPNPVQTNLTIFIAGAHQSFQLKIADITGKMVFERMIQSNELNAHLQIDLSHVNPGIYFVDMTNESGSFVQKIIKK